MLGKRGHGMKAKDYFDRYKNGLASKDKDTYVLTFREMYREMFQECVDTMHIRHIERNDAVVSVFKEMNERYNALCRLLAKEYGNSPIKANGFAYLACDTCDFLTPFFSQELKTLNKESEDTK
jgi:hypothetical protein